ncbi:hypothetical protein ACF0H5_000937 [Mactra antiquata]
MAENAMIITLCLFLMVSQSLSQVPSPATNPCSLYDLSDGEIINIKSFEVNIRESDFLADPTQTVILPISGQDSSKLLPPQDPDSVAKINEYALSFGYDPIDGYNIMTVFGVIDRDGPSVENNDDTNVLQFNLRCSYNNGQSEQFFTVTVWIADSNDNFPLFQNLPYFKEIKEALPVQNTVYDSISSTDLDLNENKQVEYRIISGNTFVSCCKQLSYCYFLLFESTELSWLIKVYRVIFSYLRSQSYLLLFEFTELSSIIRVYRVILRYSSSQSYLLLFEFTELQSYLMLFEFTELSSLIRVHRVIIPFFNSF